MLPESTPLDDLERTIQNFKIELTRFLNGAAEVPPEELRQSIQTDVRRLHETTRSTADRFRLRSLEARFNTHSELFNRQFAEQEEGLRRGPATSSAAGEEGRFVIGDEIERETAASLYASLYTDSAVAATIDFETFISYLESQRDLIRKKSGCTRVQFRVAQEDGKRQLKARPAAQSLDSLSAPEAPPTTHGTVAEGGEDTEGCDDE